jgi:hypothetical protein
MQEVKVSAPGDRELPTLVKWQGWKLWLSAAVLVVAAIGFLVPDDVGRVLEIAGGTVELGALLLTFVSLAWAIYAVRCKHCGLRLVLYAMSSQSIGQWLQWLLAAKRCPRCGADHAGQTLPKSLS